MSNKKIRFDEITEYMQCTWTFLDLRQQSKMPIP